MTATEPTRGSRRRPAVAVAVRGLGLPARRMGAALRFTGWAILRAPPRGRVALQRHGLDPERLARRLLRQGV